MIFINGLYLFIILLNCIILPSNEKQIEVPESAKILFDKTYDISEKELKRILNYTEEPLSWKDLLYSKANSAKRFLMQTPEGGNCENRKDYKIPQYMRFVPALKGIVNKVGEELNFTNFCYQKNYLKVEKITKNSISFLVEVSEADNSTCQDLFLFFTSSICHFKTITYSGQHKIILRNLDEKQMMEITRIGIKVFAFCDSIGDTLISILKSFALYTKNPAPPAYALDRTKEKDMIDFLLFPYMKKYIDYETIEKENANFLRTYCHFQTEIREGYEHKVIDIGKYIKSGDYLGLNELVSGESCMIQYFSGSVVSHSALAIREPGTDELYIFESDERGLFKRKWKDFIEDEVNTMHAVAWFPLREEIRKNFNPQKAWDWAMKRMGMAYGDKNFIAGVYDTVEDGFPEYMSSYHYPLMISLLERFSKRQADNYLYGMINVRMKSNYTSLKEIGEALAEQNLTIEEVLARPELDEYVYDNGENWVCSTFIAGLMKAGGIFGNHTVNAQEFSPKDIYMLNIYEKNFQETGPKECTEADPGLGFCMVLGKYRIHPRGFNTIDIYDHMYEKCGSKAPNYLRKEGC